MSTSTKPSDTEAMFQAELLNEKMNQLEQQLHMMEQQHVELSKLIQSLELFQETSSGEALMSVAPGIFAKGTLGDTSELLVNVGAGIFVKKTPEGIHESLQHELARMEEFEQKIRNDFGATLHELNTFKERFK